MTMISVDSSFSVRLGMIGRGFGRWAIPGDNATVEEIFHTVARQVPEQFPTDLRDSEIQVLVDGERASLTTVARADQTIILIRPIRIAPPPTDDELRALQEKKLQPRICQDCGRTYTLEEQGDHSLDYIESDENEYCDGCRMPIELRA